MIKILRLKTGEEVISYVEIGKKSTKMFHPLNIYIEFNSKNLTQQLVLSYWLPRNLIKENSAEIPTSEVLLFLEPKKEFKEYYLNFLNGKEEENEDLKESVETLLEENDKSYLRKLH